MGSGSRTTTASRPRSSSTWRRPAERRRPGVQGSGIADRACGTTAKRSCLRSCPSRTRRPTVGTRGRPSMKVHEYQAKELLKAAGVAVPAGVVVTKAEEAASAYDTLGGGLVVVKAQVHAGG